MTMGKPNLVNVINTHRPEFGRFLYASVGEDRNGTVVTVLSALARLGLDPWAETAELVTLGRDAAQARLGSLLGRFRDVPALAGNHSRVARELSQLLPDSPKSGTLKRASATVADGHPGKSGVIWAALAILFVMFQVLTFGGSGSGQ
ncbi:MAG: hypothetical protein LJE62_00870 [Silicimonas sp.]|jgi:hypothetical protein|nr:hypothetical protein [Silicimonas sp.]